VKLSNIMSINDWYTVLSLCQQADVNPLLIAAIGWHETNWGRLGMGKYGYHLGVSCWDRRDYQYEKDKERGVIDPETYHIVKGLHRYCNINYKGVRNQVKWAVETINKTMRFHFGYPDLENLNKKWIPEDKEFKWAQSVWKIYNRLELDYPTKIPPSEPEEIPVSDNDLPPATGILEKISYYLEQIAKLLKEWRL